MKQAINAANNALNIQILDFCRHIAGSAKVAAIAHVDNYSMTPVNEKTIIEIMAIMQNFQPRVMSYIKAVNEKTIYVTAVDQWIFERDIENGLLGEAIASKLIFPYLPLFGEDYLHKKEVALKKRLIIELIENLASSFPELTNRLQIRPQYFLYEVLLSRIRLSPLLAYGASNLINGLKLNETEFLRSYIEALSQLEAEGQIIFSEGDVKISKEFLAQCQNPIIKLVNLSKTVPRTIFSSLFGTFPQLINVVSHNTEAFLKTQKINWRRQPDPYLFIDPQQYVFFQTSTGLASLSDKTDIKGFAKKMLLNESGDIEVEPLGGMLNDVYLIKVRESGKENRVLVKRFKDWSGFKWFPLTVWSLGARPFAISAQSRLAKECAINELLRSEGFHVPKILHVSNTERLIFMEFVEGENLSQIIKRVSAASPGEKFEVELAKIAQAGEIMAKVHSNNILLGDSKPDNILVKQDGSMYMIDFEQASQDEKGDRAWDVAVFMYYAGHYIQPLGNGNIKAEAVAKAFIDGYLRAGGEVEAVKKAGTRKYTRVFSIFTMWSIISVISKVCRNVETPK